MRVHRVLIEELTGGTVLVRGPEAHHLANVLRVKPGATVEAFDGAGRVAAGSVTAVARDTVTLQLEAPAVAAVESPLRLSVAVALLKSDKLSDVVRQCTELGAAEFHLLVTKHADVTDLGPSRLQRLRRVAEEAARQSGRAAVPAVHEPVALGAYEWNGAALVADPRAEQIIGAVASSGSLTIITGPEGGLSNEEVNELVSRGARAVRFGPRILRAETAPVALASAILLPLGA